MSILINYILNMVEVLGPQNSDIKNKDKITIIITTDRIHIVL